jgi:hypothetical protein
MRLLKLHLLHYHLPRHHDGYNYNEKTYKSKGEVSAIVCPPWAIRRSASRASWAPLGTRKTQHHA